MWTASAELKRLARREWPIVFVLMIVAAAVWAFIELADEVLEGSTAAIDEAILLALRDPADSTQPLGPPWLEEMMRDFTGLGGTGFLTLVTLATAGFLVLRRKHKAALAVLVAVGVGIMLSMAVKFGIDRPRPDLVPHGSYVYTASFPSGHSMMSAVVYLTLAAMLARVQSQWRLRIYILAVAVLVTLLVGFSRVYLGVHWPSDVLAGWAVGAAWALSCWLAMLLLQRRGGIEPEQDDARPGD
ncbi:MAG TPA: phosphatase PAP2 family protein [Aestuariivirgaceae bacterium]|nr:phosphatase PAP2 family protein [Aestuariivirgaceae bacterium]